ncbi:hypothetical protein HpBTM60_23510 [Helicobacter pylori]
MIIYETNAVIILLKAAPITTATAKSSTLPFKANSLNSLNIHITSLLNKFVKIIVLQIIKQDNIISVNNIKRQN